MWIPTPFKRLLLCLCFAAAVWGCSHAPEVVAPPPLEVVVSQPLKLPFEDWDTYTGNVNAKDTVAVNARVRGEIKEVPFKEGEEIKAGTVLFVIDSEPFKADLKQAEGQLTTWDAKLKFADEKVALYKPLAEKGTVSKEEWLQALSSRAEAVGGIDTAKGKIRESELNIGYCKITSPIDGKVSKALVSKGNLVNAGSGQDLLTTVIAVDPLYVEFSVNERAMLNYQRVLRESAIKTAKEKKTSADEKPVIPVELGRLNDVGFPFKGIIDFVDNQVDPKTGSVKVRAKFDNPKGEDGRRLLTPGLFARIKVRIVEPQLMLQIADRAKLTDQSINYVLVVNKAKGNEVQRKDVVVSKRVMPDGLVAVESGLTGDEWVIVEGVNRARAGIIVNPKEAPMPRRELGGK